MKSRQIILLLFVLSLVSEACGQSHNLPQPQMSTTGPPPPVGLPLPIDDYLPLLLIMGLIYGICKVPRMSEN